MSPTRLTAAGISPAGWRRGAAARRRAGARFAGRVVRAGFGRAVAGRVATDARARGGGRGHQPGSESSLTAQRRCAERERGFAAASPGLGETGRRVTSSASGVRPQTQTGSSGGQTQPFARSARKRLTRRSSSEWNEIAASRPPGRSSSQASGQRAVERLELRVDRDPHPLESSLGRVAAAESRLRRKRGADRLDQLRGGGQRAAAHDLARDAARVALLAVVADRLGEPRLGPFVDHLERGKVLARVHAHVERGVIGVGEAPLPGVELQRRDPEVHVDDVRAASLGDEVLERVGEVGADELGLARAPRPRSRRSARPRPDRGRSRSAHPAARGARPRRARGRRRRTCSRPRARPGGAR